VVEPQFDGPPKEEVQMSSMTASRKSSKSRTPRAELVVSLALAVDHQTYSITPIPVQDDEVWHAWRLEKSSDRTTHYNVSEGNYGATCDCPDQTMRHEGIDNVGCKHIRALRAMGMFLQPYCDHRPPDHWTRSVETDSAVETKPAPRTEPINVGRCDKCAYRSFDLRATAKGFLCGECREEECGVCHRIGNRRVETASGRLICPACSKRQDEAAELRAVLTTSEPGPCCSPAEAAPCLACATAEASADVPTAPPPVEVLAPVQAEAEPAIAEAPPVQIDPDDVEADPADWPAWTDEWFVNPTDVEPDFELEPSAEDVTELAEASAAAAARERLDRPELLPDELADRQAGFFRSWGSPAGEMLARAMDELALKIRLTDATTPAEFAARVEALDAEVRTGWEKIGFENGHAAGTEVGKAIGWHECQADADQRQAAEVSHRRGRLDSGGHAGGVFGQAAYCLH